MSLLMTSEAVAEVRRFREKIGLFEEVAGHRIDQRQGVILVACADGDHAADIFRFHADMQAIQRQEDPWIHWFGWNGGALRLVPNSPVNQEIDVMVPGSDRVQLYDIRKAIEMKRRDVIALYGHVPCGMATTFGISLEEEIRLLRAAKLRLKEEFPGITVPCFMHVAYPEKGRRTYFVNWERFAA